MMTGIPQTMIMSIFLKIIRKLTTTLSTTVTQAEQGEGGALTKEKKRDTAEEFINNNLTSQMKITLKGKAPVKTKKMMLSNKNSSCLNKIQLISIG